MFVSYHAHGPDDRWLKSKCVDWRHHCSDWWHPVTPIDRAARAEAALPSQERGSVRLCEPT